MSTNIIVAESWPLKIDLILKWTLQKFAFAIIGVESNKYGENQMLKPVRLGILGQLQKTHSLYSEIADITFI